MEERESFLTPGMLVDGRYRVMYRLGSGGMGEVWDATHLSLGKRRALKVLYPECSHNTEFRRRFLREARVCSTIEHDGVVRVYDAGVMENGALYMVMEFLRGTPMRDKLFGEPRSLEDVFDWSIQLATVLTKTHEIGLVHRDLKPENIMLEPRDGGWRVVVVDFGLAFISDQDEELGRLTEANVVSGTPMYLSPEQIGGKDVTPNADVYSFGIILYELATGLTPYDYIAVPKLLSQHMFVPAPPPHKRVPHAHVPPGLEALIMEMLNKDASQRPTAAEVLRRLKDLRDHPEQQGRGKDPSWHLGREARMGPRVTMRTQAFEMEGTLESFPSLLHVGFVDMEIDDDIYIGLGSSMFVVCEPEDPACQILVVQEPPDQEMRSRDCYFIGVVPRGDMDRMREFMRAGCSEVVSAPMDATHVLKKLNRVRRALGRMR